MTIRIPHAAPKSFHEDVVEHAAAAIHADAGGLKMLGERARCELDALVGIEDLRLTLPRCSTEGLKTKAAIQ